VTLEDPMLWNLASDMIGCQYYFNEVEATGSPIPRFSVSFVVEQKC
jgi:hypothetical protein